MRLEYYTNKKKRKRKKRKKGKNIGVGKISPSPPDFLNWTVTEPTSAKKLYCWWTMSVGLAQIKDCSLCLQYFSKKSFGIHKTFFRCIPACLFVFFFSFFFFFQIKIYWDRGLYMVDLCILSEYDINNRVKKYFP